MSESGEILHCSQVVVCTGTFLAGEIHMGIAFKLTFYGEFISFSGLKRFPAGRIDEAPSTGLSASLKSAGFRLGRLQTGTPARLDGKTINFENMVRQDGDIEPSPFSYLNRTVDNAVGEQVSTDKPILYSLPRTIKFRATRRPRLQQPIKSSKTIYISVFIFKRQRKVLIAQVSSLRLSDHPSGPRYCPSLEAKILRFGRDSHVVWLEPEGYDSGKL